jgi:hypothetical protein
MPTLGGSMVLDAAFLVGIAIAANAAPACRPGVDTAGQPTTGQAVPGCLTHLKLMTEYKGASNDELARNIP